MKKKWDLKKANAKYLKRTAGACGVRPGPRYSKAWLRAMRKIKRDPVRFYLDRIWYHNNIIRAHTESIRAHQLKITRLSALIRQIETKKLRTQ